MILLMELTAKQKSKKYLLRKDKGFNVSKVRKRLNYIQSESYKCSASVGVGGGSSSGNSTSLVPSSSPTNSIGSTGSNSPGSAPTTPTPHQSTATNSKLTDSLSSGPLVGEKTGASKTTIPLISEDESYRTPTPIRSKEVKPNEAIVQEQESDCTPDEPLNPTALEQVLNFLSRFSDS